MQVLVQICFGSVVLVACAAFHILCLTKLISIFRSWRDRDGDWIAGSNFRVIAFMFLVIVFSHTVQIYLWALAFWASGALSGYEPLIYFTLVSYTTLGYGDITLSHDFRIFGAMASVAGVLTFGLSTAFLVGFFSRMLEKTSGRGG